VRRSRFAESVRSIDQCPSPCHIRDNCSTCVGEPGRCVWCEDTQVTNNGINFIIFFESFPKIQVVFSSMIKISDGIQFRCKFLQMLTQQKSACFEYGDFIF